MTSSGLAVASAASLRPQTLNFQIKVWQPLPDRDFSKVSAKFWIAIPTNGQNKPDYTIAARKSFVCPHCDRAINLPTEVLVKLSMNGFEETPTHFAFQCKRCGSEINVTAEW